MDMEREDVGLCYATYKVTNNTKPALAAAVAGSDPAQLSGFIR
jgi:hypothetical protein